MTLAGIGAELESVDMPTIREVVDQALAELGPEDRNAVSSVRLLLKDRPDDADIRRGCTRDQLGCFFGTMRELGRQGFVELPDPSPAEGSITLFLQNIAPLTAARVRIVFLHEIHHALGWDEDEIQASGFVLEQGALCS